jgi:hypothetical protein
MTGKRAWITGAASGLGLELAVLLAADGFSLVLADRDRQGLEKVKERLEEEHGIPVDIRALDLSEQDSALKLYRSLDGKEVDILINNAGFGLYGFFSETPWELEEQMLRLHVMTVTHLTKLVVSDMISKGAGRVLNVSSLAAFQPGPLMSVYYASKGYILSFTEALANETKGTGVTVSVLLPGWFRTNFQKTTAKNSSVKESQARLHTVTAEKVARRAYLGMMQGKTVIIPGWSNKLMALAPRILPRKAMTSIIRRIQERLRK